MNTIHEENNVIEITEESANVKKQLTGQTYLFNYENGAPKSLRDSLSFVTKLLQDSCQHSCQEITELLSRDYSTPIMRLQNSCQHFCQEITALLSRDYSTPVKRLQHSYQEIAALLSALLSRDYNTPVKRLQHSCQEITALLSRDYSTPVKRLQHSCQEITALLSRDCSTSAIKMLECLNFFLLCTLFALLYYLYIRTKSYLALLKMAEDNFSLF